MMSVMMDKVPSLRWGPSPLLPAEAVKATAFASADCDYDEQWMELEEAVSPGAKTDLGFTVRALKVLSG